MEKREYNWLDRVDSPRDLKRLSLDELRLYCDELRHYIIEQCAVNPGHLASSLGAVELAAAMAFTCAAAGTHELSRAFEYNMGLVAELSPLIAASFEDYENDPGSLFRDRRARCDRIL